MNDKNGKCKKCGGTGKLYLAIDIKPSMIVPEPAKPMVCGDCEGTGIHKTNQN